MLTGKVAIVSGVGTGLGRSIALTLARQGAGVALAARTESILESVASEVSEMGGEAWWQRFDISPIPTRQHPSWQTSTDTSGKSTF